MAATIILTGICVSGVVFMVVFLCCLHRDRRPNEKCRVERIVPHNIIEWDVEVTESAIPGVKHAIPRQKVASRDHRANRESFEER